MSSHQTCFSTSVGFERVPRVPNIIIPNEDGMNDVFLIPNSGLYTNSTLRIMNRWGKEVFSASPYQDNWRAQGLPSGLYFYRFETGREGKAFQGWIEVVR